MTTTALAFADEPGEWDDKHEHMLAVVRAAGLHRPDPKPGYMTVVTAVEDVDGLPLAVTTTRLPTIESP